MAKKKTKKVRITREKIKKLSRFAGLEFSPDDLADIFDIPDIDDIIEGQKRIIEGCVDWLHYGETNAELTSVRIFINRGLLTEDTILEATEGAAYRRSDGILAGNLNDFRAQFEQAANFGHGAIIEISLGRVLDVILFRCACPCDEDHASAFPTDDDGLPGIFERGSPRNGGNGN